jgi:tetratricopeptide (TPR) repeat protein
MGPAPEASATEVEDAIVESIPEAPPSNPAGVTADVPVQMPHPEPAPIHEKLDELVKPIYTDDYFMQQGVHISSDLPETPVATASDDKETEEDKSLMVMLSFGEWLQHFKKKAAAQEEEQQDKKALKTMWQKEKLAAAIEEENEEIPEEVFDMAMNSIAKEDGLASESLAEIHIKQGKYDKAIEMFQKLSLRNPEKSAYFAHKIEEIKKDNII